MVEDRTLQDAKIFLFTDNSTSKMLYKVTLPLPELEMKGNLILHMLHYARAQQKVQADHPEESTQLG
jgi:hypothetical protein